jgi:hypothetical protein
VGELWLLCFGSSLIYREASLAGRYTETEAV